MPARGFKPRDKALVEEAVDLVEQWIVEPSRDETFRTIMDPGRLHRRTGHVAQLFLVKLVFRFSSGIFFGFGRGCAGRVCFIGFGVCRT